MPAPARCVSIRASRKVLARAAITAQRLLIERLDPGFGSPTAWVIMLDLYVRDHTKAVSLKALCSVSDVPVTTTRRIVSRLVDRGFLVRSADRNDSRCANLGISRYAVMLLDRYFDEVFEFLRTDGSLRN